MKKILCWMLLSAIYKVLPMSRTIEFCTVENSGRR